MAARIWMNFTRPMAPTKRTIAVSMSNIRFFMTYVSSGLSPFNVTLVEQRSADPSHLRACDVVIGLRGNLVESRSRQIVLAREDEKVGGKTDRVTFAFG